MLTRDKILSKMKNREQQIERAEIRRKGLAKKYEDLARIKEQISDWKAQTEVELAEATRSIETLKAALIHDRICEVASTCNRLMALETNDRNRLACHDTCETLHIEHPEIFADRNRFSSMVTSALGENGMITETTIDWIEDYIEDHE